MKDLKITKGGAEVINLNGPYRTTVIKKGSTIDADVQAELEQLNNKNYVLY